MERIDLGHIKTTHRIRNGVDQTLRLFNKTQKKDIINQVKIGVNQYNMTVEDVLKMYDIYPAVYYGWLRKEKRIVTKSGVVKKWSIEIMGTEQEAHTYLNALTEAFAIAVKFEQPLDHAYMSNRNSSLTCEKTEG